MYVTSTTLMKQCVFICFPNYFLFTVTAQVARPNFFLSTVTARVARPILVFYRDRAGGSRCACVHDSVHVAPGGAQKTCWNTYERQRCLRGNYRQFVGSSFSDVNGIHTEGSEHRGVEAPWEMSMSCCMCEPMETARSLWR